MYSLSASFMCELQYGTTPSLEFGESPRPRSPIIVLYRTLGVIGIVFIALRKRLFGERESTLLERRIGFSSAFSIRVTRSIFWLGRLLRVTSRIIMAARLPISPRAMLLPRSGEA